MYATKKIETFRPACKRGLELLQTRFIFCLLISGLFSFTAATNTALAGIYYLDAVNGDDSNPGTSEKEAWETLEYAAGNVSGSDTVYIRGGTYGYWQMHPAPGYSSTVTWQAYQDEIPDINGLRWQENVGTRVGNIKFVGLKFTGEVYVRGFSHVEFNKCDFIGDGYKFGYIHQEPGEYEDSTALNIENANYVNIYDCNITGTGPSLKDTWGADINSGLGSFDPDNFGKGWGEGISLNFSPNSVISGCTISQVDTGVRMRDGAMEGSVIRDNTICNITNDAITIAGCNNSDGTYSYIEYNHIYNLAHFKIYYEGVWQDQSAHNDCIQFFTSNSVRPRIYKNMILQGNIAHDSDQQGFFTQAQENDDNIIWQNNLIYNVPCPGSTSDAHTVYFQGEEGAIFRNNTVLGDALFRYGSWESIHGNIFYAVDFFTDEATTVDYENYNIINRTLHNMRNHTLGNNTIVYNNEAEFQALFVDYANGDYRLLSDALAIDFCPLDKAPTTDLEGNLRVDIPGVENNPGCIADAGCYEYVSDPNSQTYSITATPGLRGQISPSGTTQVASGGSQTYTITADPGYDISDVVVDGSSVGAVTSYPFTNVTANHTIDATFAVNTTYYTITATPATPGPGGQVSPSGTTQVASGGSQIYSITENPGYYISDVVVDGSSVGAVSSYPFTNVTADHTITATFAINTYTITASTGNGGQISPSGTMQVASGGSQTYTITADPGYDISDVVVDGSSVGDVTSYPFSNVTANHTIDATFAVNTTYYTITATPATPGPGGQVSPSGTTQVASGGSQIYSITENAGYYISDVVVDGSSVGAVSSYPFTNVTTDHTITATFAINTYTITASTGNGGQISPSGNTQVVSGDSQEYTITENTGYDISDVVVDGISVGAVSSYPFTNVTTDHTITASFAIDVVDETAPRVANSSPAVDSIQAPLNTLVTLHVVDDGEGVDPDSVTINVNDNLVYSDNTATHNSTHGKCHRIGTKANYTFIYQPKQNFEFDESVSVKVNARDLANNPMAEYSYSFKTEMRSFGEKKTLTAGKEIISSGVNKDSERPLATVSDSSGNVWVAWTEGEVAGGQIDNRDIYLGKLTVGAESFESGGVRQVTKDAHDQSNPVLAIDSSDKIYLAWQDERNGKWDLFISTSADGTTWTAEKLITDPNFNQTNPAMAIDSSDKVYIAYDDDQNTDKDIYITSSSDTFSTQTTTQITSAGSGAVYDQNTPDIAIDSADTVYVVWADARNWNGNGNIKYDMYGAASDNSWTNIEIVDKDKDGQQTAPKIATEDTGTILHFVWIDDEPGDKEVYYGSSDGLPGTPLTGTNIIDQGLPNLSDGEQPEQKQPALAVTGYTGGTDDDALKVFACWEDERYNKIENIHAVEMTNLGTNIWVGDDGAGNDQKVPAIGIDPYNHPYLVWVNNKSDIIYTGSTFIDPDPLVPSTPAPVSSNTIIGTPFGSINDTDDVSVEIPTGAYLCDMNITISKIRNPQKPPSYNRTFLYEFGQSGTTFSEPVTITIPYNATTLVSSPSVYWYNPLIGLYSQEGINDVEVIQITSGLYALRFKTTHFSIFGGGGPFDGGLFGGGGGGGGCSMSPDNQAGIGELMVPYIGLTVAMVILKLRDMRKRKARNTTKN